MKNGYNIKYNIKYLLSLYVLHAVVAALASVAIYNNVWPTGVLCGSILVMLITQSLISITFGSELTFIVTLSIESALEFIMLGVDYSQSHVLLIFNALSLINYVFTGVYLRKVRYVAIMDLEKDANTDKTTQLLAKRAIISLINSTILDKKSFYLIYLDIDNFKVINDSLGHSYGDKILKTIADAWKKIDIGYDTYMARWGGDEFMILLSTKDAKVLKRFIKMVLTKITESTRIYNIVITGSAGVVSYPDNGCDYNTLLKYVDVALYNAKKAGKNKYKIFDETLYDEIKIKFNDTSVLNSALDSNGFMLNFQPQYSLKEKRLSGFETLVRIKSCGTSVSPEKYIKIAEENGKIYDVDRWVLHNALIQGKEIVKANKNIIIAINISGKHIGEISFRDEFINEIKSSGFPPENLEVEITESAYIKNINEAIKTLNEIKILKCKIALDDFGTGYSSISYLAKLPIDIVKIDKSFIDNIDKPDQLMLVKVIIDMSHTLSCNIIAEGVETEEQLAILRNLGADFIQGYIWGKPMEFLDAVELSLKNNL